MADTHGDCPGCTHPSPHELSSAELGRIPKPIRTEIEATPGRPMICGYCGCVYKVNTPAVVFGSLDNPLKGKGWVGASS